MSNWYDGTLLRMCAITSCAIQQFFVAPVGVEESTGDFDGHHASDVEHLV